MKLLALLLILLSCGKGSGEINIYDLKLRTIDGQVIDMKDHRGKVILADFWATWCAPCRKSMPELDSIYKAYRGRVLVIGFSEDNDPEVVKEFVKQVGVSYPIVMSNRKVKEVFGPILGLPTMFIIGPDGRLIRKFLGYQRPEVITGYLQRALGDHP